MEILNLFAGIGGNRKLWQGHRITAIEINPQIAEIYQKLYPDDTVIVTDAHEYLANHKKIQDSK
jgi:DNA (cytosine-5)-methyltransferase 1